MNSQISTSQAPIFTVAPKLFVAKAQQWNLIATVSRICEATLEGDDKLTACTTRYF